MVCGGDGLVHLAAQVLDAAKAKGVMIVTAESCTGGAIASRVTEVPGASGVFQGGVVAYSNDAKADLLGVPADMIEVEGAVSEAVALAMAAGARTRFGADIGVSTTGIAGPGGGTPEKPVGTVWLAYDDGVSTRAVCLQFTPDRATNIALSVTAVLNLVRRQLLRGA